jgi:catechol 2,3-dioxygenase-like lactoylglutathione lyase family enzyme
LSPLEVLGIDHVVLRVRDLDRALRFYVGVLGCPEERRVETLGLVQLRSGRTLIDLVDLARPLGAAGGAPPGPEGRNLDHFALELARFDEQDLRAHLEAHGVEPGPVARRYGAGGYGPSMYVRDPDGNVVELKGPPES